MKQALGTCFTFFDTLKRADTAFYVNVCLQDHLHQADYRLCRKRG